MCYVTTEEAYYMPPQKMMVLLGDFVNASHNKVRNFK